MNQASKRRTPRRGASVRRRVADVQRVLDAWAPPDYAADWDNIGLLAGRPEWTAARVLVALDLTDAVAREALERGTDLLVVYHPPIFKGIRSITPHAEAPTTLLPDLLAARVSIIALHTALDAAPGGTNDVLLDPLAPAARYPLEPVPVTGRQYKLVVFVPPAEAGALRGALAAAGAGVIGHYEECSFALAGRGTFRGDATTSPAIGRRQVLESVDELRLEMVVPRGRLGPVVRALYAAHSYEEPAFDLYPLEMLAGRGAAGLGRVGVLARPTRGTELLARLRDHVDLRGARVVGDLKRRFTSVTAAAGAFGVRAFRDPESLVLTGEFKHHDGLDLLKRGVTAVQLGHYASEEPMRARIRARLRAALPGLDVRVARAERDPLPPLAP